MSLLAVAAALLLAASDAADLQAALERLGPDFRGCLELAKIEEVSLELHFRVDEAGKPASARVEGPAIPESASRCLLAVLARAELPRVAAGADVIYPVSARRAVEAAAPAEGRRAAGGQLRLMRVDRPLGDAWAVVDGTDIPLSDLALVELRGTDEQRARLDAAFSRHVLWTVLGGATSAAGFVVGGLGARSWAEHKGALTSREQVMLGAGGAVWVGAGLFAVYQLIRAVDVDSEVPLWHHLSREEAEALVGVR